MFSLSMLLFFSYFHCSPFCLCTSHFSFHCLVLYSPLTIHLILLRIYIPLPSLVFLSIPQRSFWPDTTWTTVSRENARIDPVCDHLGGDCHLPSVSSHLHLNLLLPAGPADRPQHHPQEPVHQPLHCRAALPYWYWQDRIPCESEIWYLTMMLSSHLLE